MNLYRRKNLKCQYILMVHVRTKYYSSTTMTRPSRPRLYCRLPYMKGFIVDAISLLFRVHEWLCLLLTLRLGFTCSKERNTHKSAIKQRRTDKQNGESMSQCRGRVLSAPQRGLTEAFRCFHQSLQASALTASFRIH